PRRGFRMELPSRVGRSPGESRGSIALDGPGRRVSVVPCDRETRIEACFSKLRIEQRGGPDRGSRLAKDYARSCMLSINRHLPLQRPSRLAREAYALLPSHALADNRSESDFAARFERYVAGKGHFSIRREF